MTTKDGYILSMQRIPTGQGGKKSDKPPVLLQHGVLMVILQPIREYINYIFNENIKYFNELSSFCFGVFDRMVGHGF